MVSSITETDWTFKVTISSSIICLTCQAIFSSKSTGTLAFCAGSCLASPRETVVVGTGIVISRCTFC